MEKRKGAPSKPKEETSDLDAFSKVARLEERLKDGISNIETDSKGFLEKIDEEKNYLIKEYERLDKESELISKEIYSRTNSKLRKKEVELSASKEKIYAGLSRFKNKHSELNFLFVIVSILLVLVIASYLLKPIVDLTSYLQIIYVSSLVIFIFVLFSYFGSRNLTPSIDELLSETGGMETSLRLSEIEISKIKIPSFKDTFTSLKNKFDKGLNLFKEVVLNTAPTMKKGLEIIRNRERYKNIVDKFILSMSYYRIILPDSLKNDLKSKKPMVNEETVWETHCIDMTRDYLQEDMRFEISKLALELFYREHLMNKGSVNLIWKHHKKEIINDVAKILFVSDLLPRGYAYKEEDVSNLLESLDEYDLEKLRKMIHEYGNLVNVAKTFEGFLNANGINHKLNASLAKVYNICKDYQSDRQFNLLLELSKESINAQIKGLDKEKIGGFALFSIPIFFNRDIVNLEKSCKYASRNETTVKAVFVYFEMMKDYTQTGQKDLPKIIDVVLNLEKKLDQFEKIKLTKELKIIKASLSNGEWLESQTRVIIEAIKEETRGKDKSWELIKENKKIISAIRSLFREVKVDTIERVLESQLIVAYLINYESPLGGLMEILNELPDETKTKTKYGIALLKDGARKYKFVQYTRNSRVGIVSRKLGMNFEDFKEMFNSDVRLSVQRRARHLTNPNVTIQRVIPSKISFGSVHLENLPNVTKEKEKDIDLIELVRFLAQKEFTDDEIAQIAMYDGRIDLLRILDSLSVNDLIRNLHGDITRAEEKVLDNLDTAKQILEETDSSNMTQLCKQIGQYMEEHHRFEEKISTALEYVLKKESTRNYEKRAREFAKSFVLMLSGLSSLFA